MVRPTISGMIVEARDQVRMTAREPARCTASTFFMSFSSTYGPFLVERDTSPSPLLPSPHDELVALLLAARAVAQRRLAPWRLRARVADGRLAFAAAVRVVDGVHRGAAHLGPAALPARPARLTQLHQRVLRVADLAHRGHAVRRYPAHLPGRQPQKAVLLFLRHQLRRRTGAAHHLPAPAGDH